MMMSIVLTQGKHAIIDDDMFELVSRFRWFAFSVNKRNWYARCTMSVGRIAGKGVVASMYMHRLIMRPPESVIVDHVNHNGLDCRKQNMRLCTQRQNCQNRRPIKGCSSRYKGVFRPTHFSKWQSQIKIHGTRVTLGRFDSERDAARAYDVAARQRFGEFACTNF